MSSMNFSPKDVGMSRTEWKKLPPSKQAELQAKYFDDLSKQLSGLGSGNSDKGLVLEKGANSPAQATIVAEAPEAQVTAPAPTTVAEVAQPQAAAKVAEVSTPSPVTASDNKAEVKDKTQTYINEYTQLYKDAPATARQHAAQVLYPKELREVKQGLEKLANSTSKEDGVLIRNKYMAEYATDKEVQQYNDNLASVRNDYDKNPQKALNDYIALYTRGTNKNDVIKPNEDPVQFFKDHPEKLDKIARAKALTDTVPFLKNEQYETMAVDMIADRHFSNGINRMVELTKQLEAAKKSGNDVLVQEINAQAIAEAKKLDAEGFKAKEKDMQDLAQIMGEAKRDKEIAQEKFENTAVHWDKTGNVDKNDGKTHTTLNNKIRAYVQERPDLFCDEVTDGPGDFMSNGKAFKFNSDKYKDHMLYLTNENATSKDSALNADYYSSIKDRKDHLDDRTDKNFAQAKLKDRDFAKQCFEAAGIEGEKDNSRWMRTWHITKGGLKGAGIAGAGALLAEGLSTLKTVKQGYTAIADYSGQALYTVNGTVDFTSNFHSEHWDNGILLGSQDTQLNQSKDYTHSGKVDYDGKTQVNGVTSGRPDINWGNVGAASAIGFAIGAVSSVKGARNIYDEGDKQYTMARKLVTETPKKPVAPPPTTTSPPVTGPPTNQAPPVDNKPKEEPPKYDVIQEPKSQGPLGHKIGPGDNPYQIITAYYPTVKYGSAEYKQIQKEMYELSGYNGKTNLVVGQFMQLPTIDRADGTKLGPDPNAKVKAGDVKNNNLGKANLNKYEAKAIDGKFVIVYAGTSTPVPGKPKYNTRAEADIGVQELVLDDAKKKKAEEEANAQ